MRIVIIIFIALLFCIHSLPCAAQDSLASATVTKSDTTVFVKKDTNVKKKFQPDPKRAGLYSALIPGLGQCYNRQYWKMPIVYAAMGTTIYLVVTRNNEYQRYRKAYVSRIADEENSDDEFQGILSTAAIKQYQDEAKQNMDMMVVFTVIGYAGQIMEAIAGAHLRNFDISKDLSMQFRPVLTPVNTLGIGLVVNFKK
ncbi:MAG: DUF5683 domain-containing protein [Bacteroidota bacterium]